MSQGRLVEFCKDTNRGRGEGRGEGYTVKQLAKAEEKHCCWR